MSHNGGSSGGHPWPQDKIDQLISLLPKGLSARVMAAELGVTRNSIIGRIRRLKIVDPALVWEGTELRTGGKERRKDYIYPVRKSTEKPNGKQRPSRAIYQPPTLLMRPKRLVDRNPRHDCAFIPGEPTADAICCGGEVVEGRSYCEFHEALTHCVYVPRVRRPVWDERRAA